MTTSELSARVTIESAAACAALALVALAGWGVAAGAGVAAAGAITIGNFRWLARTATAAVAGAPPRRLAAWMLASMARLAGMAAAVGTLFALEWVHPVALVTGCVVLPFAVVVRGLTAARVRPQG